MSLISVRCVSEKKKQKKIKHTHTHTHKTNKQKKKNNKKQNNKNTLISLAIQRVGRENADQIVGMRRLVGVFTGITSKVTFFTLKVKGFFKSNAFRYTFSGRQPR